MDHSVSTAQLTRPWRTATMVATAVAVLELVLLIVFGIGLLGRSIAPHVRAAAKREALTPAAARSPAATASAGKQAAHPAKVTRILPRGRTRIVVLNGNGLSGAAAEASALAKARGYAIETVGNAPRTGYARTMVMYRPGRHREAVRFAHDLGIAVVTPLDGMKPAQLHGAQLVEILGASH